MVTFYHQGGGVRQGFAAPTSPVVALNHAVAVAMTHGPGAGLERLGRLETDRRIAGDYRLEAVRAHLLEMAGQHQAARAARLSPHR